MGRLLHTSQSNKTYCKSQQIKTFNMFVRLNHAIVHTDNLLTEGTRAGFPFRQDLGNWVCKKNPECIKKTGCVKCWLATLAIHSFSILPHLQPKINKLLAHLLQIWLLFEPNSSKNLKNV